jgi:hypothetical protein
MAEGSSVCLEAGDGEGKMVFAGTALLLAVVGIYGVIAHTVVERTKEVGIRRALRSVLSLTT